MPTKKPVRARAPAALGFRAHSGWAALVVVAGTRRSPVVIERKRIILADPKTSGSKQPYHFAERMELKKAETYVEQCIQKTKALAREGVRAVMADLRRNGHLVVGGGLLLGSGRPVPALAAILASHPMIHTAEGELFRDALRHACRRSRLPVLGLKEREVFNRGSATLKIPIATLQLRLNELSRSLGPPWRQDEKLAALTAWLVLAGAKG